MKRLHPLLPALTLTLTLTFTLTFILRAAEIPVPTIEQRGAATQLIVDGKPWLILGGETANTISSSLSAMEEVWPKMTRLNLNTVLVAVRARMTKDRRNRPDIRHRHHHMFRTTLSSVRLIAYDLIAMDSSRPEPPPACLL